MVESCHKSIERLEKLAPSTFFNFGADVPGIAKTVKCLDFGNGLTSTAP